MDLSETTINKEFQEVYQDQLHEDIKDCGGQKHQTKTQNLC